MNKPNNARRSRGRPQGKRGNPRGRGNNAQGRPRVNPKPQLEKYRNLAREAEQSGDRITAENYWQHVEHYQRILNEMQPKRKETAPEETADADADSANGQDAGDQPAGDVETSEQRQRKPRKAAAANSDPAEAEQPAEVRSDAELAEQAPPRRRRTRTPKPDQASETAAGADEGGEAA